MTLTQPSSMLLAPSGTVSVERLMTDLHSTLEVHQLLDTLHSYLKELLEVTGLKYECNRFGVRYLIGDLTGHTVEHVLSLNDLNLGAITYVRSNEPFTDQQLRNIEVLSNLFLLPLRNCLRYFEAVEASMTDPLTQINNRAAFDQILEKELSSANRYNLPLSLLLIDIDDFKKVNDQHGHAVGDMVLKSVAEALVEVSRQSDRVFRYGGEEFALIMGHTGQDGAMALGQRICDAVSNLSVLTSDKIPVTVTVSIGTSSKEKSPIETEQFFKKSDTALYKAKSGGKNQVLYCDT